ncbi:MAG: hypothetical protein ABSA71_15955 [Desulfomonilia bacterium]|jgi:hypothetical protein
MSTINNVNNSLLSSLLNSLQTGPTSTQVSNAQTQASGTNATDIVSLSNYAQEIQNDDPLLDIDNQGTVGSDSSIYNLLSGNQESNDSSDSLYNIMLSDENAKLMQSNPSLAQDVISEEQAQTTGSGSSSSTSQSLNSQAIQDIENMSPDTLLSILQQYVGSANSASQTTSATQVDQTV